MAAGVYITTRKDGSIYYRVSITFKNKHISLGSFNNEAEAGSVYEEAFLILFKEKHNTTNTHRVS